MTFKRQNSSNTWIIIFSPNVNLGEDLIKTKILFNFYCYAILLFSVETGNNEVQFQNDCVRQPVMSFASITAVDPISLKGV